MNNLYCHGEIKKCSLIGRNNNECDYLNGYHTKECIKGVRK